MVSCPKKDPRLQVQGKETNFLSQFDVGFVSASAEHCHGLLFSLEKPYPCYSLRFPLPAGTLTAPMFESGRDALAP
jgi:hypothetical protein